MSDTEEAEYAPKCCHCGDDGPDVSALVRMAGKVVHLCRTHRSVAVMTVLHGGTLDIEI